jgi:hypothetical protein
MYLYLQSGTFLEIVLRSEEDISVRIAKRAGKPFQHVKPIALVVIQYVMCRD